MGLAQKRMENLASTMNMDYHRFDQSEIVKDRKSDWTGIELEGICYGLSVLYLSYCHGKGKREFNLYGIRVLIEGDFFEEVPNFLDWQSVFSDNIKQSKKAAKLFGKDIEKSRRNVKLVKLLHNWQTADSEEKKKIQTIDLMQHLGFKYVNAPEQQLSFTGNELYGNNKSYSDLTNLISGKFGLLSIPKHKMAIVGGGMRGSLLSKTRFFDPNAGEVSTKIRNKMNQFLKEYFEFNKPTGDQNDGRRKWRNSNYAGGEGALTYHPDLSVLPFK